MSKYGLIGKSIAHSLSPMIYRELIDPSVHYDLLDYDSEALIPELEELFKIYSGINITSPYKTHFIGKVVLTENAKNLGAINCLGIKNGVITGENTDYLAILDILDQWKKQFTQLDVLVLGDGVMSRVAQKALLEIGIKFDVKSRRLNSDFENLNIKKHFESSFSFPLIINSCAREYVCQSQLPDDGIFWDFNYKFKAHEDRMKRESIKYVDGFYMLKRQAEYAVEFWSIKK